MRGGFAGMLSDKHFFCPQTPSMLVAGNYQRRPLLRFHVAARSLEAGVGVWGTKAGMTQIFRPDGTRLPCTVIALEPGNIVTQVCLGHQSWLPPCAEIACLLGPPVASS